MKIAIIGYGQMGQLLEKLAPDYGMEVVAIIDPQRGNQISAASLASAEVCLDFTWPEAVLANAKKIINLKKNLVIGTTGWQKDLPKIVEMAEQQQVGVIYSNNFSIGMNSFFLLVEKAAQLMNQLPQYDAFGYELHHNKKKDSPSGTATSLAKIVTNNLERKNIAQFDRLQRKIEPQEFHLASIRSGNIPGTHLIGFDSAADSIELKHTARNREGFAQGALQAADWIFGKEGIYDFQEIFYQILMAKA